MKLAIVVSVKRTPCDIYVGRKMTSDVEFVAHDSLGNDGYFGNPFAVSHDDKSPITRRKAISQFRAYFVERLANDAEFLLKVASLRGKVLGCWCHPLPCHADVIAAWVNAKEIVGK